MAKQSKNFLYTAIGAAFGLGGITRFPALCLEYGGAFIIAYAVVLVFAAAPLLAAELALGSRHKGAFPFKSICPLGGAVGALSAINSAAMCACYGVIIAIFAVRACTFHAGVNYGYPADMPQLSPLIAALVFIALAFLLTRRAGTRAIVARIAVIFQAALLCLLAARGLLYSNAPAALSAAFSNAHICGIFGCVFYCSLTLTAFVSALSLARPAYVWACTARVSPRTASFAVCAAMLAFCLPFAFGLSFSAVDRLCCNVFAPLAAAGEAACFAFHALTKRARGGKIDVWKILDI